MPLDRSFQNELHEFVERFEAERNSAEVEVMCHDEKVEERSLIGRLWHYREDSLEREALVKEVERTSDLAELASHMTEKFVEREYEIRAGENELRTEIINEYDKANQKRERLDDGLTLIARMAYERDQPLEQGRYIAAEQVRAVLMETGYTREWTELLPEREQPREALAQERSIERSHAEHEPGHGGYISNPNVTAPREYELKEDHQPKGRDLES
jgi:hypothetical protein